jgi:anti-sigma-K factor RskA
MNTQDQQLSDLLKHWPDIEPPPNFTAEVWRRIRLSLEQPAVDDARVGHWLRRWLWQPAFSVATALVIGAVVGTWGGMRSVRPQSTLAQEVGFLAPGTLAGSYLRLTSGVTQ